MEIWEKAVAINVTSPFLTSIPTINP